MKTFVNQDFCIGIDQGEGHRSYTVYMVIVDEDFDVYGGEVPCSMSQVNMLPKWFIIA